MKNECDQDKNVQKGPFKVCQKFKATPELEKKHSFLSEYQEHNKRAE